MELDQALSTNKEAEEVVRIFEMVEGKNRDHVGPKLLQFLVDVQQHITQPGEFFTKLYSLGVLGTRPILTLVSSVTSHKCLFRTT